MLHKVYNEVSNISPHHTNPNMGIADSGTNINLGMATMPCVNKTEIFDLLSAHLPAGSTMETTHQAMFDLPEISH